MDNAAAKGVPWKYAQPIYDPYSHVIADPYGSKIIQERRSPAGRSASWRRSGSRRLGVSSRSPTPRHPAHGRRSAAGVQADVRRTPWYPKLLDPIAMRQARSPPWMSLCCIT